MKFLCDQMLARLGRWLRAAGYDTIIVTQSLNDQEIYQAAQQQQRLLLTRDRHFLNLDPEGKCVIWLTSNTTEECVQELSLRLPINWLLDPFSRCLECNGMLAMTENPDVQQIPENLLSQCNPFWTCSACGKVYWLGSHTDRMKKQLELWQKRQKER